jgi:hypothetical protein
MKNCCLNFPINPLLIVLTIIALSISCGLVLRAFYFTRFYVFLTLGIGKIMMNTALLFCFLIKCWKIKLPLLTYFILFFYFLGGVYLVFLALLIIGKEENSLSLLLEQRKINIFFPFLKARTLLKLKEEKKEAGWNIKRLLKFLFSLKSISYVGRLILSWIVGIGGILLFFYLGNKLWLLLNLKTFFLQLKKFSLPLFTLAIFFIAFYSFLKSLYFLKKVIKEQSAINFIKMITTLLIAFIGYQFIFLLGFLELGFLEKGRDIIFEFPYWYSCFLGIIIICIGGSSLIKMIK